MDNLAWGKRWAKYSKSDICTRRNSQISLQDSKLHSFYCNIWCAIQLLQTEAPWPFISKVVVGSASPVLKAKVRRNFEKVIFICGVLPNMLPVLVIAHIPLHYMLIQMVALNRGPMTIYFIIRVSRAWQPGTKKTIREIFKKWYLYAA